MLGKPMNTCRTTLTLMMTRIMWMDLKAVDSHEEEWRCVLEGGMAQCVMTPGTTKMPLWSADNWDSHHMV
ncbi:MAG: hypothetical protein A6F71_05840 [Cycloclasticus sp. symbiont of Poecilosclerida sp. M]|nr:MAG: hypothetical protein A6F71_05840 [Cycloclasticus sp. symbiont of Poecilosclerida sp. M]